VLDSLEMDVTRWSISLVAVIGLIAATIAGAAIWLMVTDPVSVANAVSTGDVTPIMRAIGEVIFDALRGLFRYL
jgi:multidrug resistance efflux pump